MAESVFFYLSLILLALAGGAGAWVLRDPVAWRLRAARGLLGAAAVSVLGTLVTEGIVRGRLPFAGLFHLLIGVSFLVAAGGLIADVCLRMPLYSLGSALAGAAMLAGALFLDPSAAASKELLANRWIGFHIACMLTAYAAFALGFLAAVLFLFVDTCLKRKRYLRLVDSLPALETLDVLETRAIAPGFILFTIGLVVGYQVQRLETAYATDWRLDPKVVWTAATWLAYLIVLVARWSPWLRGRRIAVLTVIGFLFVIGTAFGARTGFHVFPASPPPQSDPARGPG